MFNLAIRKISIFKLVSVAEETGLKLVLTETTKQIQILISTVALYSLTFRLL